MSQNMRNQCTKFCRQSDREWKQHLMNAGCLGFFVCFSVVLITNAEGDKI